MRPFAFALRTTETRSRTGWTLLRLVVAGLIACLICVGLQHLQPRRQS